MTVETFAVDGSDIRASRVEAVINAPVGAVMAVFKDVDRYPEWVPNCSEAAIIDRQNFYQYSAYQVSEMPWPVSNRDLALEFEIQEIEHDSFRVELHNRADAVPATDYVRIKRSEGVYHIKPLGSDKTLYTSEQHFEPEGALPAWLVNQLLTDLPVKTVEGMRKMVTQEPYRSRDFKRDAEGTIIGWKEV